MQRQPRSMEHFDFDLVVIGGGSGGYAAARTAHAKA
jgi:pyruvate/2-oxoglutarate dehydrogenase complex dihydrolipoamide dehydrogenase (E3) component